MTEKPFWINQFLIKEGDWMQEGRIVKSLSGFYYVETKDQLYTCKGRGVFRNKKISPLVGDFVELDETASDEGYITHVKPRKNELVRPPVANVTQGMIVSSVVQPNFSSFLTDRFITLLEYKQMKPVLLITKIDLANENELKEIKAITAYYEAIGYSVFLMQPKRDAISVIKNKLDSEVTVLAGQSGAGKSTLLNHLAPSLNLQTKEISTSLGRGKHTTRHVELFSVANGLVADTPGFSSLEFPDMKPEELSSCFIEFETYKQQCKFRGCLHYKEPNCKVKDAVDRDIIAEFRYKNYVTFLEEILNRKPRY